MFAKKETKFIFKKILAELISLCYIIKARLAYAEKFFGPLVKWDNVSFASLS